MKQPLQYSKWSVTLAISCGMTTWHAVANAFTIGKGDNLTNQLQYYTQINLLMTLLAMTAGYLHCQTTC